MVQDGSKIVIFPSHDVVRLEKRADGGWNLHNEETGVTTWNVTETEVERLIEYQKLAEQREKHQKDMADAELAIELSNAWDTAHKYNEKLNFQKKRANARENDEEFVLPTTACSVAEFIKKHGDEITLVIETRYYEPDPSQLDPTGVSAILELECFVGHELMPYAKPNRRQEGIMGPISVRARIAYTTDMLLPYPAIRGGTVGCGNRAPAPRFLLNSGMLECNYQEFLMDAFAAGWIPASA